MPVVSKMTTGIFIWVKLWNMSSIICMGDAGHRRALGAQVHLFYIIST